MDIDIPLICKHISYGDWVLYYNLLRNMDAVTYAEWMQAMTQTIRDMEEEKMSRRKSRSDPEGYPMLPQMSTLIM